MTENELTIVVQNIERLNGEIVKTEEAMRDLETRLDALREERTSYATRLEREAKAMYAAPVATQHLGTATLPTEHRATSTAELGAIFGRPIGYKYGTNLVRELSVRFAVERKIVSRMAFSEWATKRGATPEAAHVQWVAISHYLRDRLGWYASGTDMRLNATYQSPPTLRIDLSKFTEIEKNILASV